MSETTERPRSKMLALKEKRGPVSEKLLESIRQGNQVRAAIKKALSSGPLTVPELAEATGLETRAILWTVTSMRKYGAVIEDSLDGSYPRYALAGKDPR
jgi:predicted transcriptional regulator